jgi:hypothetical protein
VPQQQRKPDPTRRAERTETDTRTESRGTEREGEQVEVQDAFPPPETSIPKDWHIHYQTDEGGWPPVDPKLHSGEEVDPPPEPEAGRRADKD